MVKKLECISCKLVWFQFIETDESFSLVCPKCGRQDTIENLQINFHDN